MIFANADGSTVNIVKGQRRQEQRKFGRRAVSIHATIEVDYRTLVSCVVRNLSEGGALLELIDTVELPQTFVLRLHNSDAKIACELTRSTGNTYGVAFNQLDGAAGAAVSRVIRDTKDATIA